MAHQCPFRDSSLHVDVRALPVCNLLVITVDGVQDLVRPARTTQVGIAFSVQLITVAAFAHPAYLVPLRTIAATETPFASVGTLTAFLTGDVRLVAWTCCILAGTLV
jgi:hypothetical protein